MNDFLKILHNRRSHRKFESKKIEREKIDMIIQGAFTAPSSKNCRSSRFLVIEDSRLLHKMSEMRSRGSSFLKDAPAAIVVMANTSLTDLWAENCAISATIIQLTAESLGLGSCWVHVNGRPHNEEHPERGSAEDYLRSVLPHIEKNYKVECIIAIGYPHDEPKPYQDRDDSDKVVFL